MIDWDKSDELIQRLDFSSCGDEIEMEEDSSIQEEDSCSSSPQKSWDFHSWRANSPLKVTPKRKVNDLSLTQTKVWVSPTVDSASSLRKNASPAKECPGTPLHYVTWRKLQLCDTPHTPKVRKCLYIPLPIGFIKYIPRMTLDR